MVRRNTARSDVVDVDVETRGAHTNTGPTPEGRGPTDPKRAQTDEKENFRGGSSIKGSSTPSVWGELCSARARVPGGGVGAMLQVTCE